MALSKQGVDIRATTTHLMFRSFLQDSSGAIVTSGTTSLYLYEIQSDGTLKSYDFNDNTFKTTALTTETASMTHRAGNNGSTDTGIWTYVLTTLSGFTAGGIYLARVKNTGASPTDQVREFQFGEADEDLNQIADAVLIRNASNTEGTAGEHSLTGIILQGMESSITDTTMTIKKTDGSTTFATKTISTTPGAAPIRGIS